MFMPDVLLIVTYSPAARGTLRNVCQPHEDGVVRQLERAVLFEETEFGVLQALRLCEKHGGDVQTERTRPFNEFAGRPEPGCRAGLRASRDAGGSVRTVRGRHRPPGAGGAQDDRPVSVRCRTSEMVRKLRAQLARDAEVIEMVR